MKLIRYRSFRRHDPKNCAWCEEFRCRRCGAKPLVSEVARGRMFHRWGNICPSCWEGNQKRTEPRPPSFLNLLADAIASWIKEHAGRPVNPLNPGNLWDGSWSRYGPNRRSGGRPRLWPHVPIDRDGYLAPTAEAPDAAIALFYGYLYKRIRSRWCALTLRQLIERWPRRWCEPSEEFLNHVQDQMGGIPVNLKLSVPNRCYDEFQQQLLAVPSSERSASKANGKPRLGRREAPTNRPTALSPLTAAAPFHRATGERRLGRRVSSSGR